MTRDQEGHKKAHIHVATKEKKGRIEKEIARKGKEQSLPRAK